MVHVHQCATGYCVENCIQIKGVGYGRDEEDEDRKLAGAAPTALG